MCQIDSCSSTLPKILADVQVPCGALATSIYGQPVVCIFDSKMRLKHRGMLRYE